MPETPWDWPALTGGVIRSCDSSAMRSVTKRLCITSVSAEAPSARMSRSVNQTVKRSIVSGVLVPCATNFITKDDCAGEGGW